MNWDCIRKEKWENNEFMSCRYFVARSARSCPHGWDVWVWNFDGATLNIISINAKALAKK